MRTEINTAWPRDGMAFRVYVDCAKLFRVLKGFEDPSANHVGQIDYSLRTIRKLKPYPEPLAML